MRSATVKCAPLSLREFNSVNCRKRITRGKPGSTPEKQKQKRFHRAGGAGGLHGFVFFVVSLRIQAPELLRANNPPVADKSFGGRK